MLHLARRKRGLRPLDYMHTGRFVVAWCRGCEGKRRRGRKTSRHGDSDMSHEAAWVREWYCVIPRERWRQKGVMGRVENGRRGCRHQHKITRAFWHTHVTWSRPDRKAKCPHESRNDLNATCEISEWDGNTYTLCGNKLSSCNTIQLAQLNPKIPIQCVGSHTRR